MKTDHRTSIDKIKHGTIFFDVPSQDILVLISGDGNWKEADRIAFSLRTLTLIRYRFPFTNRCFVPQYSEDIPASVISPVTRS